MNKKILFILASASPRRKKLLTEAGYEFKQITSKVNENNIRKKDLTAVQFAEKLALLKAMDVAMDYPDSIVLGADTIAESDGEIIGKAVDEKHAEQIIKKLFSNPHKVITAVAILKLSRNIKIIDSATTIVYPKKLSKEQIARHLSSQTWRGKAGAYSIGENSDSFVEKIDGSLTNVMGLPMELLEELLKSIRAE